MRAVWTRKAIRNKSLSLIGSSKCICSARSDQRACSKIRTVKIPVVDFHPVRIACVRHTGPYENVSEAMARLVSLLPPALTAPDNYPQYMAIYYSDPNEVAPEDLKSDAAIVVDADFQAPEGVHVEEISGGSYARYTYIGSYSDLGDVWKTFFGLFFEQGLQTQPGPVFEMYMNDPDETPADELVTDLFAKVAGPQL